jgi:alpha 1,6-mannosyltransferase
MSALGRRALVLAALVFSILLFFRLITSDTSTAAVDVTTEPEGAEEHTAGKKGSGSWKRLGADNNPLAHGMAPRKPREKLTPAQLSKKSLREQLAFQFPYDPESKFPAYIWQTWKTSPSSPKFEKTFRPLEQSWTDQHPGFVHEVITDSVAVPLLRHLFSNTPRVLEAYEALPAPVLKADFFRYLILLARGGIYSDIDTAALQSAVDWVPHEVPRSSYGMVIGIEADPDRPDWADWYSRRIQFCQWTIQSKPGHPILREMVANITEETLKHREMGTLKETLDSIVEFTGPALWTDHIFAFFNDPQYFDIPEDAKEIDWEAFTGITSAKKVGDVIVLPITSFSPGVGQMGAGEDNDPMAFVKHVFEGRFPPKFSIDQLANLD